MLCCSVNIFFMYCLISSVFTTTMMGPLQSQVDSDMGTDLFSTVIVYFTYCIRTRMFSGLWKYHSKYCFRLLMNLLNWYLFSLCLAVVPKTAPKSSIFLLKFLSMTCVTFGYNVCFVCHIIGNQPFLQKILVLFLFLFLRCYYLSHSWCIGFGGLLSYCPCHWLPRLVGPFPFSEPPLLLSN